MTNSAFHLARPPTLFTRIAFAARRYWPLALAIIAVTAIAASTLGSRVSSNIATYEADALIVAQTLEIRAEELPRAAAAVFRAGAVERAVAGDAQIPYSPESLIPDHLDFEPVENTIAMRVVGRDSSPETAARLANLGGSVLVEELNRIGPGFGVFSLHTRAVTPTASTNEPPPLALIGILAGAMLSVGSIGLLMSLRRPVLDARRAEALSGVPLLGDVIIDPNDSTGSLADIAGLARLSAALDLKPGSVRYLVATHLSPRKLALLGCTLARFLGSAEQNVILVDPTSKGGLCGSGNEQRYILRRETLDPGAERRSPTIVVGRYSVSSRTDVTRAIDPTEGSVALVVGAGASASRIASAATSLGDRVDGIIFVHQESIVDYLKRRTGPTRA